MNDRKLTDIRNTPRLLSARGVLKALRSVRLALTLLVVMAAILIVGTVIRNQSKAQRYIYHHWWFISLLSLLCLNLFLCVASRWSLKLRKLGSTSTHAGVLVLAVGVGIGAIWGESGYVQLHVGRATGTCYDDKGRPITLPFEVRLDDFKVERYAASTAREALVVHLMKERMTRAFPIAVGKQFEVPGTPYRVAILRYEPDFVILGKGTYGSRSRSPNNPAIQVRVVNGSQNHTQWVFQKFPGMHQSGNSEIRLDYKRMELGGRIKDYKSRLQVIQGGKVVASKTIEVNKPLKYRGYAIYQSSYDRFREAWSGLEIAKDPGVQLVYLGFLFISGGVLFSFYVRPILTGKGRVQPSRLAVNVETKEE